MSWIVKNREFTILEISSIISLFTSIDPNSACSASIFEGCLFFSYLQLFLFLPLTYNMLGETY